MLVTMNGACVCLLLLLLLLWLFPTTGFPARSLIVRARACAFPRGLLACVAVWAGEGEGGVGKGGRFCPPPYPLQLCVLFGVHSLYSAFFRRVPPL